MKHGSHKALVKMQHRAARAKKFAGGWTVFVPPNRTLGVGDTPAKAWIAAALALATGKRRNSVRGKVDQMIDWYDEHIRDEAKKPRPPIQVSATANTVRKFARKRRGVYRYRDHIIVPLRPTRASTIAAAESTAQESAS